LHRNSEGENVGIPSCRLVMCYIKDSENPRKL